MKADKLQLKKNNFDIQELCQSTVDLLKPQAAKKKLSLTLNLSPDIPTYASGDPDRLCQILINLINNAVKFTERGSVTIEASTRPINETNITLFCQIKNTSIGIDTDTNTQKALFDEFTMADQSHSRCYE